MFNLVAGNVHNKWINVTINIQDGWCDTFPRVDLSNSKNILMLLENSENHGLTDQKKKLDISPKPEHFPFSRILINI